MEKSNFFYFGDSIMGQDPNGGYINLLAGKVYAQDPSTRHYFLNVGGNNSKDVLERMAFEIAVRSKKRVAGAVLFSVGMVDSGFFLDDTPSVSVKEYGENVEKIIQIAARSTPLIIVPGLTRINSTIPQPFATSGKRRYSNERILEFDAKLREVSQLNRATYISLEGVLLASDLVDGLHPNGEGHKKIFDRIAASVRLI